MNGFTSENKIADYYLQDGPVFFVRFMTMAWTSDLKDFSLKCFCKAVVSNRKTNAHYRSL